MKKAASIILTVILIGCIFTGCIQKDAPRETVREFISALSVGKWTAADNLCDKNIFSTDFFSYSKNMSRLFVDNQSVRTEMMTGTYLKAAAKSEIHGDSATVRVGIVAYDLPTVLQDYMGLVLLNGDSSENQLNMELIIPEMLKSTETVEKEITIQLKKDNGKWVIAATEELADAITGGLATCANEYETTAEESETTTAGEKDKK